MRESDLFAAYGEGGDTASDERVTKPEQAAPGFWGHVRKLGYDACWLWTGPAVRRGYGYIEVAGRKIAVHRFAYELSTGEDIPPGMVVVRTCAARLCVQPRHLRLVSGDEQVNRMAGGPAWQSLREREFHARRADAIARSIPYIEVDTPLLIHHLSTSRPQSTGED